MRVVKAVNDSIDAAVRLKFSVRKTLCVEQTEWKIVGGNDNILWSRWIDMALAMIQIRGILRTCIDGKGNQYCTECRLIHLAKKYGKRLILQYAGVS